MPHHWLVNNFSPIGHSVTNICFHFSMWKFTLWNEYCEAGQDGVWNENQWSAARQLIVLLSCNDLWPNPVAQPPLVPAEHVCHQHTPSQKHPKALWDRAASLWHQCMPARAGKSVRLTVGGWGQRWVWTDQDWSRWDWQHWCTPYPVCC